MKILITTDLFTTQTNGVVTSIKNLSKELQKKGHDVRILTLSDTMNSHRDGIVYYIRSVPIGVYPDIRMPTAYRHKLIRDLIDWRPDIIHSQCEFFSFQYALHISKHTGAPLVHTYHTLYEQYATYVIPSKRFGKAFVRLLSKERLKDVQTIIAPTRKVENALLDYGIDSSICVVPSGISLEQHRARISPEERWNRRHALGISDEKTVLINLGRLGTEKNLEELLSLFALASKENENLIFLLVGDGPARTSLELQAEKLSIRDKVIFTGMVSPSEVQEYYQLGDVFVSASTSETQGLTYVEAAANGLPLLCRYDLCLQDVLKQGENGYAYNNEEEFLKDLEAIHRNPQWRESASRESEKIAENFDKKAFGDAVERIYYTVLQHISEKESENP